MKLLIAKITLFSSLFKYVEFICVNLKLTQNILFHRKALHFMLKAQLSEPLHELEFILLCLHLHSFFATLVGYPGRSHGVRLRRRRCQKLAATLHAGVWGIVLIASPVPLA